MLNNNKEILDRLQTLIRQAQLQRNILAQQIKALQDSTTEEEYDKLLKLNMDFNYECGKVDALAKLYKEFEEDK